MSNPADADHCREKEIAARFRALWDVLRPTGEGTVDEFRSLMRDRIRDALDRGAGMVIDGQEVEFIANTFVIDHLIAENAATEVHAVRHRDTGTIHALKCAKPECHSDPIMRDFLLREAEIGLTLCHPHIIRTHMLLRLQDGRPAILMEKGGLSLSARVRQGLLSARMIPEVVRGVLLALDHLSRVDRVHADISPGNILVAAEDPSIWKLCDFGLCRRQGERLPLDDLARAGTDAFQAPEQTSGVGPDQRSDLYSLGRVLQWMLDKHTQGEPVDDGLRRLAAHLTMARPDDRPEHAQACLERYGLSPL